MGMSDDNDDDNALPFDVGPVKSAPYSNDTTSKWAAEAILPYVKGDRETVVRILMKRGDFGATDQEMQKEWGKGSQSQCNRRKELVEMGIVVWSKRCRPTEAGNDAYVWILNPNPDPERIEAWYAAQRKKRQDAKDIFIGYDNPSKAERKRIKEDASTWKIVGPRNLKIFLEAKTPTLELLVNLLESDPTPHSTTTQFLEALREIAERVEDARDDEDEDLSLLDSL